MRVALQNIHLLPFNLQIHDYIYHLLRTNVVSVLYFSDRSGASIARSLYRISKRSEAKQKLQGIKWASFDYAFTIDDLRAKADVLLNLNLMCLPQLGSEFPKHLARFDGLKIFHVGDYFYYRPGSISNRLLERAGVQQVFGYAMHDRYCTYFRKHFPSFEGKVWGIPFGYAPRFRQSRPFGERRNKVVAVGSVNPLRPLHEPVFNFQETADFFPDECWFHHFRRQLVLAKDSLIGEMDSMLPQFPLIKDFKYDLVAKFNEYRMLVTCESIYCFPSAKVFEGPACGTALVCADHDCIREYGFESDRNCVMHRTSDLADFRQRVAYYQSNESQLSAIAAEGNLFVHEHYSHAKVADHIRDTVKLIWESGGKRQATSLASRLR